MNRNFRTASAFMRHVWLIEPVYAELHLPLVNSYLSGTLPIKAFDDEDDDKEESEDPLARVGYALATSAESNSGSTGQTRYGLDDPELPDNSVFVLDIRGAIFKESTCCSIGTEDYVQLINKAYANGKIIGVVCLIDSPGGQLSGTPTLYDAIKNPQKPTVSVVNEGLMASAAYWLACGSDFIYATQKTDQIGSIGVFVQFNDTTEQKAKLGIKTHTIYSDRSTEKNLPFREALAGNDELLKQDLNMAADLFREAVEEGRGERLKPATKNGPDVFKGGVFYASKAIELGLIDGFGNLDTAVAKVAELHQARQSEKSGSIVSAAPRGSAEPSAPTLTTESPALASAPTTAPGVDTSVLGDTTPDLATDNSDNPNPNDPMFGDKHKALTALAGEPASSITDEQLQAINANLDTLNIKGVRIISTTYATEAVESIEKLNTANQTIKAKEDEITRLNGEVERLGKQPGAMGSRSQKLDEQTGAEGDTFISETDAELIRLKGQK